MQLIRFVRPSGFSIFARVPAIPTEGETVTLVDEPTRRYIAAEVEHHIIHLLENPADPDMETDTNEPYVEGAVEREAAPTTATDEEGVEAPVYATVYLEDRLEANWVDRLFNWLRSF